MTLLLGYTVYLTYLTIAPQVMHHLRRSDLNHAEPDIFTFQKYPPASGDSMGLRALVVLEDWLYTFSTALHLVDVRLVSVGLLALLAIPFPAGLLVYHSRLICAGMTAIESEKWKDWREEIKEGRAFLAPLLINDNNESCQNVKDENRSWPKCSRNFLALTSDRLPPRNLEKEISKSVGEDAEWRQCRRLEEVENIYNLGTWGNWKEVLLH